MSKSRRDVQTATESAENIGAIALIVDLKPPAIKPLFTGILIALFALLGCDGDIRRPIGQ